MTLQKTLRHTAGQNRTQNHLNKCGKKMSHHILLFIYIIYNIMIVNNVLKDNLL